MSTVRPHPHFDDRGTLDWHVHWDDALAAARREGKLVFIEMGREACGNCRTLVQSIVPRPRVAELLKKHFVGLASDADDPEPQVICPQFRSATPDEVVHPGRFQIWMADAKRCAEQLRHAFRVEEVHRP